MRIIKNIREKILKFEQMSLLENRYLYLVLHHLWPWEEAREKPMRNLWLLLQTFIENVSNTESKKKWLYVYSKSKLLLIVGENMRKIITHGKI